MDRNKVLKEILADEELCKKYKIKEVEIFETGTLIKVLNNTLTEDMVMSMMVDPDTGEKVVWL